MSLVKEFREFALRGNVIDLAVGVVIGAAFGKFVSSFVSSVVMPPLNLITAKHGVNFSEMAYSAKARFEEKKQAAPEDVVLLREIRDSLKARN